MPEFDLDAIRALQEELAAEIQAEETARARAFSASRREGPGVTPAMYDSVDVTAVSVPEYLCDYVPGEFVVRDSGRRESFASGMVRDTEEGKVDFTLVRRGPMYRRWAEHMTKGAVKYGRHNWTNACSQEELERFQRSALRHFEQWLAGDRDEDHGAAVMFNINAAEYVREQLTARDVDPTVEYDVIDPHRPWGPAAWEGGQ